MRIPRKHRAKSFGALVPGAGVPGRKLTQAEQIAAALHEAIVAPGPMPKPSFDVRLEGATLVLTAKEPQR